MFGLLIADVGHLWSLKGLGLSVYVSFLILYLSVYTDLKFTVRCHKLEQDGLGKCRVCVCWGDYEDLLLVRCWHGFWEEAEVIKVQDDYPKYSTCLRCGHLAVGLGHTLALYVC